MRKQVDDLLVFSLYLNDVHSIDGVSTSNDKRQILIIILHNVTINQEFSGMYVCMCYFYWYIILLIGVHVSPYIIEYYC